jgi:hypothetical protein
MSLVVNVPYIDWIIRCINCMLRELHLNIYSESISI